MWCIPLTVPDTLPWILRSLDPLEASCNFAFAYCSMTLVSKIVQPWHPFVTNEAVGPIFLLKISLLRLPERSKVSFICFPPFVNLLQERIKRSVRCQLSPYPREYRHPGSAVVALSHLFQS